MSLTSLGFLIFCLVVLGLYYAATGENYRKLVLLGANIVFIGSYAASPLGLLPLAAFILLGYAGTHLVRRYRYTVPAGIGVAAFILLFIWLKQYSVVFFLPPLPFAYLVVGMSYMLFRMLHLMFEIRDEQIEPPSFIDYLVYVCFFLCFVSGPIQRYQDFDAQRRAPERLDDDGVFAALSRIFRGYIKIVVVAELLHLAERRWQTTLVDFIAGAHPLGQVAAVLVYAVTAALYGLYLYANFSGYVDLVIGIGRLFGFSLPENFDRPWLAGNFLDLWSRWHITLSLWFRTYFFNPLLKAMMYRWDAPALAPYLAVLAFFATFLVLGAWHGASSEYLLCGFLFGAGVSLNKLYQVEMAKRLGRRRYQALARHPVYHLLCRGLTMAYFALAMTTFWLTIQQMHGLVLALGISGILLALVSLGIAIAAIFAVLDLLAGWRPVASLAAAAPRRFATRAFCLGVLIVLLALFVPWIGGAPQFVYQAF